MGESGTGSARRGGRAGGRPGAGALAVSLAVTALLVPSVEAQARRSWPAGRTRGRRVKLRALSAWEAVKEQLAAFVRGYVERDVSEALGALSEDFTQDESILRNAIQRDYQDQSSIHVDLELLTYKTTFDGAAVSLRWLRTATLNGTGVSVVNDGLARVLHDRHDGYRILTWLGPSPFGSTDPAWQKQTEAGDPALGSGFVRTQSFAAMDSNPGDPENLAIDLEGPAGNVTRFRDADCPGCAGAPQDLVLSFVQVFPHLSVAFFSVDKTPEVQVVADNAVPPGAIDCPGASTLEDVGDVDPQGLILFKTSAGVLNVFPGGAGSIVFGAITGEGHFALLEVSVRHVGGLLVDVTLRWRNLGVDPTGGAGGLGC